MTRNEFDDDDAQWLDLLAGRSVPQARPSSRVEASWLRSAMLSVRPAIPVGDMPDPEARVKVLLAKAQAAGLLPTGAGTPVATRLAPAQRNAEPWARRLSLVVENFFRSPVSWATSAVLAIGVFLALPPVEEPQESVLRGPAVQQLVSADPSTLQSQVAAVLVEAGFGVTTFDRLGRPGLEVTLPEPPSPAQRAALRSLGLAWPEGSQLVVEFAQTSGTTRP